MPARGPFPSPRRWGADHAEHLYLRTAGGIRPRMVVHGTSRTPGLRRRGGVADVDFRRSDGCLRAGHRDARRRAAGPLGRGGSAVAADRGPGGQCLRHRAPAPSAAAPRHYYLDDAGDSAGADGSGSVSAAECGGPRSAHCQQPAGPPREAAQTRTHSATDSVWRSFGYRICLPGGRKVPT